MEKLLQLPRQLLRSKRLPVVVIALALAVLGATIGLSSLRLRGQTRGQIAGRDGEILQAVSRLQQEEDAANNEVAGSLEDPGEQFNHILKIARLQGVLGIRLFTRDGVYTNSFPAYITEGSLREEDLARLQALQPVSHFYPRASLDSVDLLAKVDGPGRPVALLEVNVPLQAGNQNRLLGVAQFILQGDSIARECAALDQHLITQALIEFGVAGGILALVLGLAFRKIHLGSTQLAAQAERLARANQELALAARTSAVGAVASHLIHGLKNPLSGLQGFVKGHVSGQAVESEEDWRDAMATTQRMHTLISGVARVLEEQQASGSYEIAVREVGEIISARMLPLARAAGVHFYTQVRADGTLANREANLLILILENLVQNALQATPEGKSVRLSLLRAPEGIQCEVRDEGPGLPAEIRGKLFSPCRSTKPGGSGLGLAISRQLALNIGAELDLKSSDGAGCVFCLSLPRRLILPALGTAEPARAN